MNAASRPCALQPQASRERRRRRCRARRPRAHTSRRSIGTPRRSSPRLRNSDPARTRSQARAISRRRDGGWCGGTTTGAFERASTAAGVVCSGPAGPRPTATTPGLRSRSALIAGLIVEDDLQGRPPASRRLSRCRRPGWARSWPEVRHSLDLGGFAFLLQVPYWGSTSTLAVREGGGRRRSRPSLLRRPGWGPTAGTSPPRAGSPAGAASPS